MNFNNPDGTLTDAQICDEIRDYWIGSVVGRGVHTWQSNSLHWVKVQWQQRQSTPEPPFSLTIAINGQQTSDATLYTPVAGILKFVTPIAGRKGRGRVYVPGVNPGFTTNGLTNDTFHTYADTAITNMKARFLLSGSSPGPIQLLVGPRNGIVLGDYHYVTDIQLSNFVGIQRRRNIGFGV